MGPSHITDAGDTVSRVAHGLLMAYIWDCKQPRRAQGWSGILLGVVDVHHGWCMCLGVLWAASTYEQRTKKNSDFHDITVLMRVNGATRNVAPWAFGHPSGKPALSAGVWHANHRIYLKQAQISAVKWWWWSTCMSFCQMSGIWMCARQDMSWRVLLLYSHDVAQVVLTVTSNNFMHACGDSQLFSPPPQVCQPGW